MPTTTERSALDTVLITDELEHRISRPPDLAAENEALGKLARELTDRPEKILQRLVEIALRLCRADSTGVSILEPGGEAGLFRWHAIAGNFAKNLYGTLPREASPCGTVIDQQKVLLFSEPARFFPASRAVEPPIYEALLAPFFFGDKAIGTVWAIMHEPERHFDAEDARLLESLSSFAAAGYNVLQRTQPHEEARASRIASLNLIEDAVEARDRAETLNRDLEKEIAERKRYEANLAFLAEVSKDLVHLTNIDETMDALGAKIGAHFQVPRVNFADVNEAADEAVITHEWHTEGLGDIAGDHVHRLGELISDVFHEAARAGEMIVVRDTRRDPRTTDAAFAALDTRAFVTAPFVRGGRWLALTSISDAAPRDWPEDEIELLRELTTRIWIRLESAQAEKALRASEQRLQRMVNVPRVGVLNLDKSGAMIHANDAFLAMIDYTREELGVGKFSWRDFTPPEHMEASDRVMEQVAQTGRGGPYEKEYFRKDGSRVWLMFVASDLGDGTIAEYVIDVSDRKRAEVALRESEEDYRTLFTSIDEGFCTIEVLFDKKGKAVDYRFLEINPAFARQTGLENASGKTIRQLAPDHEEFWFEIYGRIAKTGEAIRFEHVAAALGRFYDVYAFRIGEPTENRVAIIFNEISSRKHSEEALRESEERLRALVDNLPGGAVFVVDHELRYEVAAGEALALAGFTEADFVGRTIFEMLPPELAAMYEPRFRKALAGEAFEHEHSAHGRTFLSRGVPLSTNGETDAVLAISYDITDRKRAEEALKAKETELQEIIDGTPFMLTRCSRDLRYRFVSRAYAQVVGRSPEEIAGRPLAEIMEEETLRRVQPYIDRVLEGERVEYEDVVGFREGRAPCLHVIYSPDRDEEGNVIGWFASMTDVTERKRIEEALRASEERFRQFAENSTDVFWIVDAETRTVEYLNPVFEKMWGASRKPILANISHWSKVVHPEDRECAAAVLPNVFDGKVTTVEYRILRPTDHTVRWIRDTAFPIRDESGRIVRVAGVEQDVTDERERTEALSITEERFRLLVEGAREYAMFLLDTDNKITYWSKGAERVFGWRAEEAVGQSGELVFTPEDRVNKEEQKEIETALRDGTAGDRRYYLRKDGTRLWVDGVMRRLDDEETGALRGFAKIARDATGQRKTEEDLQRAHDELELRVRERTAELQRRNRQLHDEMQRRRTLEKEIVHVTERERARISQDLHDSLCQELTATAFLLKSRAKAIAHQSRAASDSLIESAATVNANAGLARDLARGLHPMELGSAGLPAALRELSSRTNDSLNCRCDCPRSMRMEEHVALNLYRIAQEAATNSIKHANANQLVIALERTDGEIVLTISDDGSGSKKRGRGLGMNIMKYRASAAGGELEVESSPKRGTTVTCRVPLRR